MSFKAYLDNIEAKTSKTPTNFIKLAADKGLMLEGKLNPKTKETKITNWLKEEFDLGHDYAKAIVAFLKGKAE